MPSASKRTRRVPTTCAGILQRLADDDDGIATLGLGDDVQLMLPATLADGLVTEHVTAAWASVEAGDDDSADAAAVAEAPADGLRLLGIVYRADETHVLISCGGIVARVPAHDSFDCGAHVQLDVMPTRRPRSRGSAHATVPVDAS